MTLSEKDQLYNWHPYTQHKTAGLLPTIVKGKDEYLWDENGKVYIDAIASWWVNPFGHSNKELAKAIYDQLTTLEHVLFGGFTHNKVVELSEKLTTILPSNQKKFFYSDNGSTAVEVALKASFQYFQNKGIKKNTFIAFENAFHGDTFGAMAVSGIGLFTEAFKDSLLQVIRIPVPTKGNEDKSKKALKKAIKEYDVAGFIFEPLILGAAGMVIYEAEILDELIEICQKNEVFTIADEVMTGFGKTGKFFACNYLKKQPDMMCLSKALTGGTIPMAVTTFSNHIFEGFISDNKNHAFFHGHTYTANPTGCAAALKSIQLLEHEKTWKNIERINNKHTEFSEQLQLIERVENIRIKGIILAFDIKVNQKQDYYSELRNKFYNYFISKGVILRPVGNTIYILPSFIISNKSLKTVYQTIIDSLEEIEC